MRAGIKLIALACLVAALAPLAAEEAAKKEWEGTWECVSKVVNGKEANAKGYTLIHTADGYKLQKGDKVISEGMTKRDIKAKPKAIDTTPTTGKGKGMTVHGIYEIKGDTMRLCLSTSGKDRPKEFAAPEGSGNILETWKRVGR